MENTNCRLKAIKLLLIVAATVFALSLVGRSSAQGGAPSQLTPEEKRGKQIYLKGVSPSGKEMTALLTSADVEVPASTLACAGCHGLNGQGKPEGGIRPSNIVWESLTKPYGVTHADGRKHPPYTEGALGLAVALGVDPAGNRLLAAMPRYRISREDMADLTAYLKRLGKDSDPGVTETTVKVGTILPTRGPLAEMGKDVKAMLLAYFDSINEKGGIYNRQIELCVAETGDGETPASESLKRFIGADQVFALVSPFLPGADEELRALAEHQEVPLIGPLTLSPRAGFPINRHAFYLFSGLSEQSRALVIFAKQKLAQSRPRVAVIHFESDTAAQAATAIKEQCNKAGWGSATTIKYSHWDFDTIRMVRKLKEEGADALFFIGAGAEAKAILRAADQMQWAPQVFIPAGPAARDLFDAPASFKDKLFISFPTLPSDLTRAGTALYTALADKHNLEARHPAAQLSALSAARVLTEALTRAGRDLSREKLVSTLEGFYQFDTGLTPPISYGPNRRIGALGAYVVSVDLEKRSFVPASAWIIPD